MADIKRTVTVYDQNTQEKTVIENVTANTLGELKGVLSQHGINLSGMDIREGISRIDLKADTAILPHDTPYRGGTTNDLMILLTKTNKKVSSGAMGRSEAAAYIKENGLGEDIKKKFGKNWTNVPTADLVAYVEKAKGVKKPAAKSAAKPEAKAEAPAKPAAKEEKCGTSILDAFNALVNILEDNGTLEEEEAQEVRDILGAKEPVVKASKKDESKGFSQDEILEALRGM